MKIKDIELFNKYMNEYFSKLKLSGGLFYSADIALRFQIGLSSPPYHSIDKYMESVYIKSQLLFEAVIDENEELFLVINVRQDSDDDVPKIKDIDVFKNYLKRRQLISGICENKLYYTLYEDDEEDGIFTYQFVLKCNTYDIKVSKLLKAIANQDVGIKPQVYSECYFININRNIIYYLYDDRGLDIVGHKKETIKYLYDKYNEWLMDYDKERMKSIFTGEDYA